MVPVGNRCKMNCRRILQWWNQLGQTPRTIPSASLRDQQLWASACESLGAQKSRCFKPFEVDPLLSNVPSVWLCLKTSLEFHAFIRAEVSSDRIRMGRLKWKLSLGCVVKNMPDVQLGKTWKRCEWVRGMKQAFPRCLLHSWFKCVDTGIAEILQLSSYPGRGPEFWIHLIPIQTYVCQPILELEPYGVRWKLDCLKTW